MAYFVMGPVIGDILKDMIIKNIILQFKRDLEISVNNMFWQLLLLFLKILRVKQ